MKNEERASILRAVGRFIGAELREIKLDLERTAQQMVEHVRALQAGIDAQIQKAIAAMPAPRDGRDGVDGKSVTVEDLRALIDQGIGAAVAALPAPRDGRDGVDGKSVTVEDLRGLIDQGISAAVAALPPPRDGADGKSVTVEDLQILIDRNAAAWALDFERRAQGVLERAAERIPKPRDGRDALELEDFDIALQDDGRTLCLRLRRGEAAVEKSLRLPTILDRGVYKTGHDYERGDGVTWAGSFWIAQRDTAAKPGEDDSWRLAVRRGRDGRGAQ